MRARTGFGVTLETESRPVRALNALQSAIKKRVVGRLQVVRQTLFVDSKAMVLTADRNKTGAQVLNGMIGPVMTKLHLRCAGAAGKREELVRQTDSEDGQAGF